MLQCSSHCGPGRTLASVFVVVALAGSSGAASAQAYRDYKGLSSGDIVRTEIELLGVYTKEIAPQCADLKTALDAVTYMINERDMFAAGLDRFYPIDQLEGIAATDAVDDSLARDLYAITKAYLAGAGQASTSDTTGALMLFRRRIATSPGVGEVPVPFATIAAVRFGRDALTAARASGKNETAAEDAFLRYTGDLATKYMDARRTLRRRYQAEVQNEDWVLARLKCPSCGAQDWEVGALFMKIKHGTSDYYHTRDLTCRKCGKVITWDFFLPSYTLMNKVGAATLPGEPPDSTGPKIPGSPAGGKAR